MTTSARIHQANELVTAFNAAIGISVLARSTENPCSKAKVEIIIPKTTLFINVMNKSFNVIT